jgi:mono/diheme cytochrome c family protein
MKPVTNRKFLSAFLLAGALTPAAALGEEAAVNRGEQIAAQACTYCHGFNNIAQSHKQLTAEEWEFYFYDMVSRGAPIYEEDLDIVLQYLIDTYAVDG